MNAKQHFEKAIREGVKYADEATLAHRRTFQTGDINRMSSTLSAGLVVLTEEMLRQIVEQAFLAGNRSCYERSPGEISFKNKFCSVEEITEYASRIMREVKEGNDGK